LLTKTWTSSIKKIHTLPLFGGVPLSILFPANLVKDDEIYDKVTIKKELLPFVYDIKIKKLVKGKTEYICRLVDKTF
jgi:hypothetical protein